MTAPHIPVLLAETLAALAVRAAGRTTAQAAPRVLFVLSHSPSQVMVAGAGTSAACTFGCADAGNAKGSWQHLLG